MAAYAANIKVVLDVLHMLLLSLESYLAIGANYCPTSATIETITSIGSFDCIVVGAGEAGSVMIHGVANKTNASILVLEEGGCPPLESNMPGLFTLLPVSTYDRQWTPFNDSYACQNIDAEGSITSASILGGSSAIHHLIYVTPFLTDYNAFSTAANDPSWGHSGLAKYFAVIENIQDTDVIAQNTSLHGTSGLTQLRRQLSSAELPVIAAYEEMGLTYKNDSSGECVTRPLLTINDCGVRQSGTVSYISKINNTNVYFRTGAVVEKVLFNGTTAVGVQFTYNGISYNVTATKKVVLSAGALRTPQILMNSGYGDSDILSNLSIPVVVNNTQVGRNLMDHVSIILGLALDNKTDNASTDYRQFPVSMVTAYANSTNNGTVITRQDIDLIFPVDSEGLLPLCSYVFKYKDRICDAWYEYNLYRRVMFMVITLTHPVSRGITYINSTNITDQPIVKLNLLSNSTDLDTFADQIFSAAQIVNTTAMKNLGAEIIYLDNICSNITKDTLEYWKCYGLQMSSSMWHYSGTCMMGKVVDNNLHVFNTSNLMAVDACMFPGMTTGNIASTVRAVAAKAVDILSEYL